MDDQRFRKIIRPLDPNPTDEDFQRFNDAGGMASMVRSNIAHADTAMPNELWLLQGHDAPAPLPPSAVQKSLEDLLPHRTRVCYRITREIARQMGWCSMDESLAETLMRGESNLWSTPMQPPPSNQSPMSPRLRNVLNQAPGGITIEPPAPPTDDPAYDPMHDPRLKQWIKAIQTTAELLSVESGSIENPHEGVYGLAGLLDPLTARLAWPGRMLILAWEHMLVEETLRELINVGILKIKDLLHGKYAMQMQEINAIVRMARIYARTHTEGDLEEDRSIMVMRLEDAVRRAKEACDTRTEIQALKQLTIVLGLSKSDPDDTLADFIATAKKVTNEARPPTNHSGLDLPLSPM